MNKTITAIATGEQPAGISIIRMSGDDSLEIIDKVFKSAASPLSKQPSHTIHYGHIYNENIILDEVLVSIFLAPRSYTTENTVEINCHGGILNTRRILELLLRNGATLAAPGEFTKRAFLNGRIDLTEAEAVADIINSENKISLNNAVYQLSGQLSEQIKAIREHILYTAASIESALDDPEHYDINEMNEDIFHSLNQAAGDTKTMIDSYDNGRMIKDGIRTVILGRPNVGKSSLLNYLSGYDSAIVTDIAGTTRDLIKERINLDGISLHIIDTAGIRETVDPIEKIGIDRSMDSAKTAELILMLIDSSNRLSSDDKKLLDFIKDKNAILLLNKTDLTLLTDVTEIKLKVPNIPVIEISIKNETGLKELKTAIFKKFSDNITNIPSGNIITSLRHKQALEKALNAINNALTSFNDKMPEDLLLVDIMDAYTAFGEILGETVDDDLIHKIFESFCMGK